MWPSVEATPLENADVVAQTSILGEVLSELTPGSHEPLSKMRNTVATEVTSGADGVAVRELIPWVCSGTYDLGNMSVGNSERDKLPASLVSV